ncbi:MAG TPA: response regulator, partial [Acidimicrobiales bacterium]|nr:response regulator [Acidimicrobiales bacterium]
RATELSCEQRDYVDTMADSAEALAALVNDVLDFSRIEAGRLELEAQPFSLRAAVEAGLSGSLSAARQKGVALRTVIENDVTDTVVGDRLRLRQVLSNLASNAVKFTDEGEIVVTVRNIGTLVQFNVVDTGIGLTEANREKLFEQYVQADNSTTRRHGGSGLGLSICRQLVQLMGGEIGVESELGHGSRFWFTVAFDAPIAAIETLPQEIADATRRVLVVSALAAARTQCVDTLVAHGIETATAADAHTALAELEAAAEGARYDSVVVGVLLGGMSRRDFVRAVRLHPVLGSTRIIGLFDGEHDEDNLVDAWVSKPVNANELLRAFAPSQPADPTTIEPDPETTPSGGHLLVVEDNRVNQKVAVAILTKLGYTVDVASDGIEALEMLDGQRFDVVLMDCQMPRMDGYEATTEFRLREREPRTPIVAMTASATSSDRERCLEVGMDDYLTKPIDPAALGALLSSLMARTDRRVEAVS